MSPQEILAEHRAGLTRVVTDVRAAIARDPGSAVGQGTRLDAWCAVTLQLLDSRYWDGALDVLNATRQAERQAAAARRTADTLATQKAAQTAAALTADERAAALAKRYAAPPGFDQGQQ